MSKRFGSVFLDPTEPKLWYSVNSARFGRTLSLQTGFLGPRLLHSNFFMFIKSTPWVLTPYLHIPRVIHSKCMTLESKYYHCISD